MKRLRLLVTTAACFSLFVCSPETSSAFSTPMQVVSHFLTSGESLSHGKRTPQKKFTIADYVVFFVAVQWDVVAKPRGKHDATWQWFREGNMISTAKKTVDFQHTPFELSSKRAASMLGAGHFYVEVYIDGVVAAQDTFTIAP